MVRPTIETSRLYGANSRATRLTTASVRHRHLLAGPLSGAAHAATHATASATAEHRPAHASATAAKPIAIRCRLVHLW